MVRCVAVIPARGGSKGVKLKNVAPLAGTTLLDLAIDSARGIPEIGDIVVTTDHPMIADRARARDVIVIDRPAALAGDDSPTVDAVRHVLDTLALADDTVVVTLQPTSPMRTNRHVEEALREFARRSTGTVVSVCEAEHHPLKTFTIDAANAVVVSIVATNGATSLAMSTPKGFALRVSANSTPGSGSVSLGVADTNVAAAGGPVASPTWTQSGTPQTWIHATVAFR